MALRALAALLALAAVATFGARLLVTPRAGGAVPMPCLGGDLVAFWGAAELLDEGGGAALYRFEATEPFHRALCPLLTKGMRVSYPPPVYSGMRALLPLGFPTGARVLMVGLFGLLVAAALAVPSLGRAPPRRERLLIAAAVVGSPAALILLVTVQLGAVWLALVVLGFGLLLGGRQLAGGLVLGLLCAKPTLAAPALLALVATGRWRGVVGWLLGGGALLAASLLVDGAGPWAAYLEFVTSPETARETWLGPWRHLTLRSGFALHLPVQSDEAMRFGHLGMGAGAALGGWVASGAWGVRREGDALTRLFALGAVFGAFLLATPHLLDYDGVVFAPAWLASLGWLRAGRAAHPRVGWGVLALAWLAPAFTGIAWMTKLPVVTVPLVAWVLWMGVELRRDRGA